MKMKFQYRLFRKMNEHQPLLVAPEPLFKLQDFLFAGVILVVIAFTILTGLKLPDVKCHGDYVCPVNCNVGVKTEDGYILYNCTFIRPITVTLLTDKEQGYDRKIDVFVARNDECDCPDLEHQEQYAEKQFAYLRQSKASDTIIAVLVMESCLILVLLVALLCFILVRRRS